MSISRFTVQGSRFWAPDGTQRAPDKRMIVRRFEDLVCWRLARDLEQRVIAETATQPARDDFDFCRQIRRSASSAPRNIAERFGRFLPGDFAKFVRTARGSLEETKDHLDAGRERGYFTSEEHLEMRRIARRALGASTNLAVYLEAEAIRWRKEGRRRPNPRVRHSEREP
jgi:four helix bundle protein